MQRGVFSFLLATVFTFLAGCKTSTPLPPADLSAPGWKIFQGQAVWQPTKNRPELAGDLLLATNVNGNFFVQFSKIPFPLASAEIENKHWQIEFGADKFFWHGRGEPPKRFVWFQLPTALAGKNLPGGWRFEKTSDAAWSLTNLHTGEKLEGAFFP